MKEKLPEIYISASIFVLIALLFYMTSAVLPFFIGATIAYIFLPVYKALLSRLKSKTASGIVTITLSVLVFTAFLLIVVPSVVNQIQSLINALPELSAKFDKLMVRYLNKHYSSFLTQKSLNSIVEKLYEHFQSGSVILAFFAKRLFKGVFSIIMLAINAVVAPFSAYYFLTMGSDIVDAYVKLFPAKHRNKMRRLIREIDYSLRNYLVGQMLVALFVGIYIAAGLSLIGIRYGLLIGFVTGVLNMIPYVGFFSGLLPSFLLAIFDNGDMFHVVGVLIVFLSEVTLENIFYPLIMSRATGLNPLLILFAVFLGGALGGLLGVVVAVPLTVCLIPIYESLVEDRV